jgi:hypothetical protein
MSPRNLRRSGRIAIAVLSSLVVFGRIQSRTVLGDSNRRMPAPAMHLQERYGDLPLAFEPNRGQMDSRVRFMARSQGMAVFFTDTEAVMVLQPSRKPEQAVVRMKLLGARTPRAAQGLETVPGISNYFIGNDPKLWHEGVPHYGRVRLSDVYSGVDLVSYGNQGKLEYDFVVAPGADPGQVRLGWEGMDTLALNADGDLSLRTSLGEIVQKRPLVYQDTDTGRVAVAAKYVMAPDHQVSFQLASYDRGRPLIIDPVMVYSTYLGGSSFDQAFGIAVDATGAAYVTGFTSSSNFPMASPFDNTLASQDVFVTKLSPSGNSLVYSTFLGGSGNDKGYAIAVDATGAAYVTGDTLSTNFPALSAFQGLGGGNWDAFVTKLTPAGGLAYSTYLGGLDLDEATGIAVDGNGAAYVTGYTLSINFPTQGPYQITNHGSYDAFVTKLAPAGNALIYSTYLGGTDEDQALGIAVDGTGAAYVTGLTFSSNFPMASAYDSVYKSGDAFVTKLTPAGNTLAYSTYLGGNFEDAGYAIAVDAAGSAYVTGRTFSTDFPTTAGAYQLTNHGNTDVFVTKLAAAGNALVYSTYLGGALNEAGWGITVDSAGSAHVTGWTQSTDFPTQSAVQTDQPNDDAFVAKLTPSGTALVYSTYLGGSNNDYAQAIAVDPNGGAYVAGWTDSIDYPTVSPFQGNQTSTDAFITKLLDLTPTKAQIILPVPASVLSGPSVNFMWSAGVGAADYYLSVGTSVGAGDIFSQNTGLATSQVVSGIPTNGSLIYVRLWTLLGSTWQFNDYTYTGGKGTANGDFDGDGKADLTVYRPSTGVWYVLRSGTNYTTFGSYSWGLSSDVPVRGDFDGDGKADIAVYRPSNGTWYVLPSSTGYAAYVSYAWGLTGDLPVPGDYDGDGKTDIAVYRPANGTWYILQSSTGYTTYVAQAWGVGGDMPVPADYDGDGKTDIAAYRPSTGSWYVLQSSTHGTTWVSYVWGLGGDVPVQADYDGDGKADVAVYRPSNGGWYVLRSSTSYTTYGSYLWGLTGDKPVPADYDGDGKADIAVYRPSSGDWYILRSTSSYTTYGIYSWGLAGDVPLLGRP